MRNPSKVALSFFCVAMLSFGLAMAIFCHCQTESIEAFATARSKADIATRYEQLRAYSDSINNDLQLIASSRMTREALRKITRSYHNLAVDPGAMVRKLYVDDNPNKEGNRHALVRANDGSEYSRLHGMYHQWFLSLSLSRDLYDLILVDQEGTVVYSVIKESIFGKNLVRSEALAKTSLGDFYSSLMGASFGTTMATDFHQFGQSRIPYTAFIGAPIYSDGTAIGALIFQLRIDPFTRILHRNYSDLFFDAMLVGPDFKLRTPRNGTQVGNSILETVQSEEVELALGGGAGIMTQQSDGRTSMIAFMPFRWGKQDWALIDATDMSKVGGVDSFTKLLILCVGLGFALVCGAVGWQIADKD